MIGAPSQPLTLEEFLKLPETKPASEYLDGQIVQKPMPQGKHSTLQTELSTAINVALKSERMARAFSELRCTFGGRSTVPDISVFLWNRIPRDGSGEIANSFTLAPDWVIEILSPEQRQARVIKNILHCLNYQTQMGWLIYPDERSVLVYQPDRQVEVFDELEAPILLPSFARDRLSLTVGDLFAWLSE